MFDSAGLQNQKLDPRLRAELDSPECPERIDCIVQTTDGLGPADEQMLATYRCRLKENLWIIKGYTAELTPKAIQAFVLSDRIVAISMDKQLFPT